MKKYISYLLMLAVLISSFSIAMPAAYAADTLVAKFDSTDDLANWWYRYSGQVNVLTNKKEDGSSYGSEEPNYGFPEKITFGGVDIYPRMGKHFLQISDVRHGGGTDATSYLKLTGLDVPVNGAAYLNIRLYAEPGDSAVQLRWAYSTTEVSTSSSDSSAKLTLGNGWQVISLPIKEQYRNGNLKEVRYQTEGYSMSSNGENYKNTTLWIDGIFLSDALPQNPKITGSSVAEGAQLVKHDVGKIDLTAKNVKLPRDGAITITPHADIRPETKGDTLSVVFDNNLDYATEYTLAFSSGVYDIFGNEFEPYTLNFRTRGEFENIPPTAEIVSPADGERFVPNDRITLSAVATDEDGTVEYVEFYCDDELIEGSRTTSDTDTFTYIWSNAAETLTNYKITAKAYDNNGTEIVTDSVTIRVMEYKKPVVELTAPADKTLLYKSVGGVSGEALLTVAAKTSDIDSQVQKVDVYLGDNIIHTETENPEEFTYTHPTPLEVGDYKVKLVATDDMNLTGSAQISISVRELGKIFPPVLTNDLTIAKWNISKETAQITSAADGIAIETKASETARLGRTLRRNMSLAPWQGDVVVVPHDTSHTVAVGVKGSSEISLVTFKPDGTTSAGTAYEAGKAYTVSAVADPENRKISVLLDGEFVETKEIPETLFSSTAELYVSHNGANSKTTVKSAEIFMLGEAAEFEGLAIYKGSALQSADAVSPTADYITISLKGGVDLSTLEGNVKIADKLSGREVAVSAKDGRIYINEILKSGKAYTAIVGSGVSSTDGKGLAGNHKVDFTVEKSPVHIRISDDGENIIVNAENSTGAPVAAELVIVAYSGTKAVLPVSITPLSLPAGMSSHEKAIPSSEAGTIIEAFVVDSMDSMRPISDEIYEIQKG